METRVCPIPNTLSYTSAPSSPTRSTSTTPNAYFFSVPTSPSRSRNLESSDPITPDSDDFRFGSSEFQQRYNDNDDDDDDMFRQDMPIMMAYADELFYEGKMLPLKLPPRLQCRKPNRSTSSSPGSTSLRLKMPFRRSRALRNDEFDPFVAALEKVKEHNHNQNHPRRSRSLSPLKWGWGLRRSKSMGPDHHVVVLSRKVNGQSPTNRVPMTVEKVEARKQRIKRFLLKSASFGLKAKSFDKEETRTALLWGPRGIPMDVPEARRGNAVVRISRGIKSLVKHKPKKLFCRTFGLGCSPKMN